MLYYMGLGLGVALAVSVAAIGSGVCQGISRQPESAGRIQLVLIIGLAFMESLAIYGLLVFFMLQGQLPSFEQVMELSRLAQ